MNIKRDQSWFSDYPPSFMDNSVIMPAPLGRNGFTQVHIKLRLAVVPRLTQTYYSSLRF
jgi:hypothetical protein